MSGDYYSPPTPRNSQCTTTWPAEAPKYKYKQGREAKKPRSLKYKIPWQTRALLCMSRTAARQGLVNHTSAVVVSQTYTRRDVGISNLPDIPARLQNLCSHGRLTPVSWGISALDVVGTLDEERLNLPITTSPATL